MKSLTLKITVACMLTGLFINQSFAQDTKPRWGINAGMAFATLGSYDAGHTPDNPSHRFQYHVCLQAGLVGITPLSNKFDFIAQLLYAQKGAIAVQDLPDESTAIVPGKYQLKLNYIDTPFAVL